MRFMMLVKDNSGYTAGNPPPPELMAAVARAGEEAVRAGHMIDTGGLMPGAVARAADGKVTLTDGPYAEAKELVAGYAIMEFDTIEEAYEAGRQFVQLHIDVLGPSYRGEVEIRPMYSGMSEMQSSERKANHA